MEVSASGNFSELAHAVRLARRRVGLAAEANLKGSAHSADPREKVGVMWRFFLGFEGALGSEAMFFVFLGQADESSIV